MEYSQWQLEKDWKFAQEILDRFGLSSFKVTYKPNKICWLYWHRYLDNSCIKSGFDNIQNFNKRMDIDWSVDHDDEFYKGKLSVIKEILKYLYLELNFDNIVECYGGWCGCSVGINGFSKWLEKNINLTK